MRSTKIRSKIEVKSSIITGLNDALGIVQNKKSARRLREVVIPELPLCKGKDVKRIRE